MKNIIRIFTLVLLVMAYTSTFSFLTLNVFLAYIPIELSFQISYFKNKYVKILLACFFILFFPNVPYLVTDVIHMDMIAVFDYSTGLSNENIRLWLLIVGMFASVFCYVLVGFTELLKQTKYVSETLKLSQLTTAGGLSFFFLLSSLGMYVGRFAPRFHSIDFVKQPIYVLKTVFLEWSYSKIELVGLFFVLHVIIVGTMLICLKLAKNAAK